MLGEGDSSVESPEVHVGTHHGGGGHAGARACGGSGGISGAETTAGGIVVQALSNSVQASGVSSARGSEARVFIEVLLLGGDATVGLDAREALADQRLLGLRGRRLRFSERLLMRTP